MFGWFVWLLGLKAGEDSDSDYCQFEHDIVMVVHNRGRRRSRKIYITDLKGRAKALSEGPSGNIYGIYGGWTQSFPTVTAAFWHIAHGRVANASMSQTSWLLADDGNRKELYQQQMKRLPQHRDMCKQHMAMLIHNMYMITWYTTKKLACCCKEQ
jgi:hypothetical protein